MLQALTSAIQVRDGQQRCNKMTRNVASAHEHNNVASSITNIIKIFCLDCRSVWLLGALLRGAHQDGIRATALASAIKICSWHSCRSAYKHYKKYEDGTCGPHFYAASIHGVALLIAIYKNMKTAFLPQRFCFGKRYTNKDNINVAALTSAI